MKIELLNNQSLNQTEIHEILIAMFDSYLQNVYINSLKEMEGNVDAYNRINQEINQKKEAFLNSVKDVKNINQVNLIVKQ